MNQKKIKEAQQMSCGTPAHEQQPEAPQSNPPPQNHRRGLQAMKEKDVNEYMAKLLDEDSNTSLEGLEGEVLGNFRAVSVESNRAQQRLNAVRQEMERLTVAIQRFQGQLDAYANLLVAAEDARRAAK